MNSHRRSNSTADKQQRAALDAAAADWLIAHDRGLTTEEQREFDHWLTADPCHAEAWAEAQRAWARLDRLPEITPLAMAPRAAARRRMSTHLLFAGAAAAALVIGFFVWSQQTRPAPQRIAAEVVRVMPQQRLLSDGTRVELNAGSDLVEQFTPNERRVRLVRGEAHFTVVSNPARPFVVEASGVAVRAVGTAFNVRLDQTAVEVLVTHGRVRLDPPPRVGAALAQTQPTLPAVNDTPAAASLSPPLIEAGQRAVVGLAPEARPPEVTAVSSDEIARALAWQALRLQFHDMPLSKVAAEFNRHNRVRLIVEPSAADTLVAGSFRAENVELFVRFLEEAFHITAERRGDGAIVLRKAP